MEKNTKENIHKNHRSRMKATFLSHGFDAFSDIEKLEFLLFFAINQKDTNPLAHKLLKEFGSFDKVLEAPIESLQKVEGLGEHSAILINLMLQVASAYGKTKNDQYIPGTISAKTFARNLFKGVSVEEFYVVCLNTANKVLCAKMINKGTSSEVPVDIRDITKIALANQCERILIAHNHPSGVARPSDEDISFTSKILFSCIINNIEVVDHVIVSKSKEFSFEESKLLPELKRDAMRKIPFDDKTKDKFGEKSNNYEIGK